MKDRKKVNVMRKILKVFLGKGQSVARLCQGLILSGGKTEGPQVWRVAEMNENGRTEALSLTTEGKKKDEFSENRAGNTNRRLCRVV